MPACDRLPLLTKGLVIVRHDAVGSCSVPRAGLPLPGFEGLRSAESLTGVRDEVGLHHAPGPGGSGDRAHRSDRQDAAGRLVDSLGSGKWVLHIAASSDWNSAPGAPGAEYGLAMATGDVDCDRCQDLIVGADRFSRRSMNQGAVYVEIDR